MKWNKKDISQYKEVKEYVDTLILPLLPITLDTNKDAEKFAWQGELIDLFSAELERNFTGRIFLMPSYQYINASDREKEIERINYWVQDAKTNPFQHIFFLTLDHHWKKYETNLDGTLLWFPAMASGDPTSKEFQTVIKDQVNQLSELIRSYW